MIKPEQLLPQMQATTTVQEYVDQAVIHGNAADYVTDDIEKVIVLDTNYGDEAFWLAKLGRDVLIVDASEHGTERFEQMVNGQPSDILLRLNRMQGTTRQALDQFGANFFDMAVSHGMMSCFEDPSEHIIDLSILVRSGGLLSLTAQNVGGKTQQLIDRGDLEGLRTLHQTGLYDEGRGFVSLYTELGLRDYVEEAGFDIADSFGVGVTTARLTDSAADLDVSIAEQLIAKERATCARVASLATAQTIHIIAHRQ